MTTRYEVRTQHGPERKVRTKRFQDYDAALAYAESISPDTDHSMIPNVDEKLASHPAYEKGLFWYGNRYAVILQFGGGSW